MKRKLILATLLISLSSFGLYGCTSSGSTKPEEPKTEDSQNKEEKVESESKDSSVKNEEPKSENEKTENKEVASKKKTFSIVYYTYDINTEKTTAHTTKADDLTVGNIVKELIANNVLPKGTEVNRAKVEEIDGVKTISVDMNSNFVNTSLGSSAEALTLQSFANSLIDTFGVKQVKLTVDGKNYSGGHIALDDGQYIQYK